MKLKKISKKAQGLPLNFIILAVISVLILIILVMFVTRGFRTEPVAAQTAINTCNSRCLTEMRYTEGETIDGYDNENSPFCSIIQDVSGVGENKRCDELTSCRVFFRDGSCTLKCTDSTSSCSN